VECLLCLFNLDYQENDEEFVSSQSLTEKKEKKNINSERTMAEIEIHQYMAYITHELNHERYISSKWELLKPITIAEICGCLLARI
jgi:hypothetical protein